MTVVMVMVMVMVIVIVIAITIAVTIARAKHGRASIHYQAIFKKCKRELKQ